MYVSVVFFFLAHGWGVQCSHEIEMFFLGGRGVCENGNFIENSFRTREEG